MESKVRNKLFNLKNIASIRSPSLNQSRGSATKSSKSDSPQTGPSSASQGSSSAEKPTGNGATNAMTAMIKEKFDQIYRATPVPTAILNEGGMPMPMPMPLSAPVPGYRHNASNMAYPILRAPSHGSSSNGSVNSNYSGNSHNSHGSSNGGSMSSSSNRNNYQPLNRNNSPRNNNNTDSTRFPMPMGSPGDYWKERERLILRGKSNSAPRPSHPNRSSTSPGIADNTTTLPKGRGHMLDLDDRMEETTSHAHSTSHSRSASTTPGSVSSANTSQQRSSSSSSSSNRSNRIRSTSRGRGQITGGDSLMFLDSLPKASVKTNGVSNSNSNRKSTNGRKKSTKRGRSSNSRKKNEVGRSGRMRKKVNYNESNLVAAAITDAQLEADGETEGEMDVSLDMENEDTTRSGRRVVKPVTHTDLPKAGAQLLHKSKQQSHVLLGDASAGDTDEIADKEVSVPQEAVVEQMKPKYNYTIIPVKDMHSYKPDLDNADAEAAAWLSRSRKGTTAKKDSRGRQRKRLQFNPDADDSDDDVEGEEEEDAKYSARRRSKKTGAGKIGRPRKTEKSTGSSSSTAINWAPMEVIALYAAHKHASSMNTKNDRAFWKLVGESMASRGITRSAGDCQSKWLSCAEEAQNRRKKMQKQLVGTNAANESTENRTEYSTEKASSAVSNDKDDKDDKDDKEDKDDKDDQDKDVNDDSAGTPVKRTPTKEDGENESKTRSSPRLKTK